MSARRFSTDHEVEDDRSPESGGRFEGDQGVTLALVSIMLVTLLLFAGFAVDVGLVYNVRRQSQSASDSGVMGGALALAEAGNTGAASLSEGAAWSKRLAYDTMAKPPATEAEFNAMWASCTDPDALANTMPANAASTDAAWPSGSATQCISYSQDRYRVHMPQQTVDTIFAHLAGVNEFTPSSSAEAQFTLNVPGGIIPFGLAAAGAANTYGCTVATSSNFPGGLDGYQMCNDNDSGNRGGLDIAQWGLSSSGSFTRTESCAAPSQQDARSRVNTALGVDHNLAIWAVSNQDDQVLCDNNAAIFQRANRIQTYPNAQTANAHHGLIERITSTAIHSGGAIPGRLNRNAGKGYTMSNPFKPTDLIDNTPLYAYMRPDADLAADGLPLSCRRTTIQAAVGFRSPSEAMDKCLVDWDASGVDKVIFTEDIINAPRFAVVPIIESFGNGTDTRSIVGFRAVYLNTTWFGGCSNGGSKKCDTIFTPGERLGASATQAAVHSTTVSFGPLLGTCPEAVASRWVGSCGLPVANSRWNNANYKLQAQSMFQITWDKLPDSVQERLVGDEALDVIMVR